MPLPRHPGLPGSRVVPDDWAAAHAPVVTKTLDCTVTIGPAGGTPTFDPASRVTRTATAEPSYVGPASIGLATVGGSADGRRVEAAEDEVEVHAYEVKLPAGSGDQVRVDHAVRVDSSPGGRLDDTRLIITGLARPGREFSRVLSARLYT